VTNLSGKTALVTGTSRGIGRATALPLSRAGAEVLVHYHRGATEAKAVIARINRNDGRAEGVCADLGEADGPHKLAKQVREGHDYALGIQALKRLAQPDDIGGVVAFLASEAARWITGDTVRVDGGSKLSSLQCRNALRQI